MRLFALRVRVQSVCEREGLHGRGRDCLLSACACGLCVSWATRELGLCQQCQQCPISTCTVPRYVQYFGTDKQG